MRRSDWLVLFLAAAPGGPLDPVRVQKGMFLLAMRAPLAASECYRFEPYAYGPMSRALYADLRHLRRDRVVDALRVDGATWQLVDLTSAGRARADEVGAVARCEHRDALAHASAIRREISGLTFAQLLRSVYEQYPEYASRSVFRGRG